VWVEENEKGASCGLLNFEGLHWLKQKKSEKMTTNVNVYVDGVWGKCGGEENLVRRMGFEQIDFARKDFYGGVEIKKPS